MERHIVLGLGYGDEGKGAIVAHELVKDNSSNTVVMRFSSGHQVGHTINSRGETHTYSNFPTGFGMNFASNVRFYWSKNCTICPSTLIKEFQVLSDLLSYRSTPLFMDFYCPITTPYDILANQMESVSKPDISTIGVGFGATIKRHTESPYKLCLIDILSPNFQEKLDSIKQYYSYLEEGFDNLEAAFKDFYAGIELINKHEVLHINGNMLNILNRYNNIIFEGNQGFMLDQERGIFPHVTRAYTTGKQAYEMLDKGTNVILDLVTRAYSTRHGKGTYKNEESSMLVYNLIGNPKEEINKTNSFQGNFRIGTLYSEELSFAIKTLYHEALYYGMGIDKVNLHVTCLDQTKDLVILDGQVVPLEEFVKFTKTLSIPVEVVPHRTPLVH